MKNSNQKIPSQVFNHMALISCFENIVQHYYAEHFLEVAAEIWIRSNQLLIQAVVMADASEDVGANVLPSYDNFLLSIGNLWYIY